MKTLALITVLAVMLAGCNDLKDLRPVDPATQIPEKVVNVVKAKFPKGEDLVFKPILEEKIWEVKLKSDAERYSSLVDYGKMWETFREVPGGVPAALTEALQKSRFASGTLSDYTTAFFATTANNKLVFNHRGEVYSFEWSGVGPSTPYAMFDRMKYRITTYELGDLPGAVADTIKAIPGAKLFKGYTFVGMDDSKMYFVIATVSYNQYAENVSMLFDGKGKLLWSSTKFIEIGVTGAISNLQTVPQPIQDYLNSQPELDGFEYNLKLVSDYRGLTSYYISVKYASGRYDVYFDKDFNVVYKRIVLRFE
ncbi:hypothetical protein J2Y45_002344 [Dyadobacter sp. BE34]|uniref:Beta-lactamase-inhibitor-like PepSY-like domain-containing protein n=1 Tax=Dyadobacter fermentans TaxID=94254 RepID=A0ABU1QW07_9BACT|nr:MULTISPECIES: hypothetical protein [Dyadobacter]MDR6805347.1 hypothetical protein [Dyadobacter fermentans]MDR7042893.1 hypothetical protein [Dyadobacter sp. BE242]MDR7197205.1 hypothetical protein [Dyadobacter sp. BE34]MDR7215360.1 hypothetical protein [Dyadobacter sp. BE31]MDR7262896.1 hypothetical protein [Dyadobacter sp. BE32]